MSRRVHRSTSVHTRCEITLDEGRSRTSAEKLVLTYTSDEPHQVQLLVGEGEIRWTFARDILLEAEHSDERHPAGLGDVTAWRERSLTTIHLTGPERGARLAVESTVLDRFVAATLQLVPAGEETQEIPDEEIRKLLD